MRTLAIVTGMCVVISLAGCDRRGDAPVLTLRTVVEASGDSVDVDQPFRAASAPGGGVYVSSSAVSGLVEEVDSSGHLKRLFGRLGSGPGEYQHPGLLIAARDRLLIEDAAGRFHFFSAQGSELGTVPAIGGGVTEALLLRGDTIVFARTAGSPASLGMPLHLLSSDGRVVKSLGSPISQPNTTEGQLAGLRTLAQESDSSFWVGRLFEYTIELWSTAGKLLKEFHLARDWFPAAMPRQVGPLDHDRPIPMLLRLHRDTQGHLVALLRRARPDWKARPGVSRAWMNPSDATKYIEQVIEVIDTSSGRLLGTIVHRDPPTILGLLDDDRVFGVAEDAAGRLMPVLWLLQVHH
jgi:hypothetical protein